jgi:hypothetical protein
MPDYTANDGERLNERPPKGRKIPHPPGRDASHGQVREWLSRWAVGLPEEVRIETVIRAGHEPEDPVTITLSNETRLRCAHQSRLQKPGSLQAFFASETEGIAQPPYLSPAEVGDFYTQLCRLASVTSKADPVADLHERLMMFVLLCDELSFSFADRPARYSTIERLRSRPSFDRNAALAGRQDGGRFHPAPILLRDQDGPSYIRASEWVAYLRFIVGWTVNESQLIGRMAELGAEWRDLQAWNLDRSHKAHLIFYSLPEEA